MSARKFRWATCLFGMACLGFIATLPIGSWAGDAAALSAARADRQLVSAIRQQAQALAGTPADYKALLEALRGKRFVLLGEDTHGSEESTVNARASPADL